MTVGYADGEYDGLLVGCELGEAEGSADGDVDGLLLGLAVGYADGE